MKKRNRVNISTWSRGMRLGKPGARRFLPNPAGDHWLEIGPLLFLAAGLHHAAGYGLGDLQSLAEVSRSWLTNYWRKRPVK